MTGLYEAEHVLANLSQQTIVSSTKDIEDGL